MKIKVVIVAGWFLVSWSEYRIETEHKPAGVSVLALGEGALLDFNLVKKISNVRKFKTEEDAKIFSGTHWYCIDKPEFCPDGYEGYSGGLLKQKHPFAFDVEVKEIKIP